MTESEHEKYLVFVREYNARHGTSLKPQGLARVLLFAGLKSYREHWHKEKEPNQTELDYLNSGLRKRKNPGSDYD